MLGAGMLAGILGGLLGIGGGIVLMPVLRFFVGLSPAFAAGTCVLAVFFTTLGGGFRHYRLGHVPLRSLIPVIISGAVATIVFSMIFIYFAHHDSWLDLGIGTVFILLSVRMIYDGMRDWKHLDTNESPTIELQNSLARKVTLGGLSGILPGLFGIGTGAILVPGFAYLLKAPIKVAIGSSLVCFAVNALFSAGLKFMQGYVDFTVAIPVCLGTLAGSQIGAIINRRSPSTALRIIFGIVFFGVSLRFILSAFGAAR